MKYNLNKKKGISLIVLVIMVVVSMMLISLGVLAVSKNIDNASVTAFANDLKEIEDTAGAYYIEYGSSYFEETISKDDVLEIVSEDMRDDFEDELELNSDDGDTLFYVVDVSNIDIIKTTKGNRLLEDDVKISIYTSNGNEISSQDIFVLSHDTLHAYYLKGITVGGINYFSISSKVKDLL